MRPRRGSSTRWSSTAFSASTRRVCSGRSTSGPSTPAAAAPASRSCRRASSRRFDGVNPGLRAIPATSPATRLRSSAISPRHSAAPPAPVTPLTSETDRRLAALDCPRRHRGPHERRRAHAPAACWRVAEPRGAFVSLHAHGDLRGASATSRRDEPLAQVVRALRDSGVQRRQPVFAGRVRRGRRRWKSRCRCSGRSRR